MSARPSTEIQRTRYERREQEVQDWLGDCDRRHGPRRFAEVEAARVADLEMGGDGRVVVADRHAHVHPVFADLFARMGV